MRAAGAKRSLSRLLRPSQAGVGFLCGAPAELLLRLSDGARAGSLSDEQGLSVVVCVIAGQPVFFAFVFAGKLKIDHL